MSHACKIQVMIMAKCLNDQCINTESDNFIAIDRARHMVRVWNGRVKRHEDQSQSEAQLNANHTHCKGRQFIFLCYNASRTLRESVVDAECMYRRL